MFVADAHCDTLYALAVEGVSPKVTAGALAAGNVGLQTFALFAGTRGDPGTPRSRALAMLEEIGELGVPIVRGPLGATPFETPHGVLSIEGAEILEGSLEELDAWAKRGVRMISLTWNYENEAGYPALSGNRKGLKPFGKELAARMAQLGVIADVSHLNDAGIEDALAINGLKVAASHSNLREVTDAPRNLPRALAKEIIAADGFIGVNFYAGFLAAGREATIGDVLRHMDAYLELGGEKAIGFGSDFDGIERWPEGLKGPADFPALLSAMARHGYPEKTVSAIAGENLWRIYRAAGA